MQLRPQRLSALAFLPGRHPERVEVALLSGRQVGFAVECAGKGRVMGSCVRRRSLNLCCILDIHWWRGAFEPGRTPRPLPPASR